MFYNGIMLKQDAPKTEPGQERAEKQAESLPSPKQQMDAIVESEKPAKALLYEIGSTLKEGKLTPEETAGIITVFLNHNDERLALATAKAGHLDPAQIRTLFKDTSVQLAVWESTTHLKLGEKDSLKISEPIFNDLSKRLAEEKIKTLPQLRKETNLEHAEASLSHKLRALDDHGSFYSFREAGLRNLLELSRKSSRSKELGRSTTLEGAIEYKQKDLKRSLKALLQEGERSEEAIDPLLKDKLESFIKILDSTSPEEIDLDELGRYKKDIGDMLDGKRMLLKKRSNNKVAPTVMNQFFSDSRSSSLAIHDIDVPRGFVQTLKETYPESIRTPFINGRLADPLTYIRLAYPDTDVLDRYTGSIRGKERLIRSADESLLENKEYRSSRDSGDPKETPTEVATLSEPYRGMLYKTVYDHFDVKNSIWTTDIKPPIPAKKEVADARHITVTLPNRPQSQILPKPLHEPLSDSLVYLEQKSGEYQLETTNEKGSYAGFHGSEATQLRYDFSPDKPHSLPAKLALEEYSQHVESPSPELREYAASSLPEHAQLFLKGVEALPVADQVKLIEAYSKKYGFYDFDNGEAQTAKASIQDWKAQIQFMQDRLTELSLTEDTSGKLYAGVCTDFQTLTSAMLLSKGLKTKVGTGFLVDGTSIKTTDSHALSLVELPTENGSVETFEVDGTPVAGTAGSEKALASLQRSAFTETLEQTKDLLSSEQEETGESTTKEHLDESSQEKMTPSHAENMISLTFSPAEKQQTKAVLDTIRFSGVLTLSDTQLIDPETTIWLSRSMETASEAPKLGGSENNQSDDELVRAFSKLEADFQQLKPKQKTALQKLLYPILASNLPPKITALFKGL